MPRWGRWPPVKGLAPCGWFVSVEGAQSSQAAEKPFLFRAKAAPKRAKRPFIRRARTLWLPGLPGQRCWPCPGPHGAVGTHGLGPSTKPGASFLGSWRSFCDSTNSKRLRFASGAAGRVGRGFVFVGSARAGLRPSSQLGREGVGLGDIPKWAKSKSEAESVWKCEVGESPPGRPVQLNSPWHREWFGVAYGGAADREAAGRAASIRRSTLGLKSWS